MKLHRAKWVLLCAAAVSACGDKEVRTITAPDPGAHVKFYNLGVGAPDVNFYANAAKVTGISSSTGVESTAGVSYGNQASGGFYSGLVPGSYALAGKISATTDKDLAISTLSTALTDGKYYSFFQSGIYNSTAKTIDSFIVEDPFIQDINFTVAYVRFVNAISNSQPMTLYATDTTTKVETALGSSVAYKSAGTFTALPAGTYNLAARLSGSSANTISLANVGFLAGKVYTIAARGDMTVTSTTAATRPQLGSTINR